MSVYKIAVKPLLLARYFFRSVQIAMFIREAMNIWLNDN